MSKVTEKDLEKIEEPCKSCEITASGRGKNKEFYCNYRGYCAKLMCGENLLWYEIQDCPKKRSRA